MFGRPTGRLFLGILTFTVMWVACSSNGYAIPLCGESGSPYFEADFGKLDPWRKFHNHQIVMGGEAIAGDLTDLRFAKDHPDFADLHSASGIGRIAILLRRNSDGHKCTTYCTGALYYQSHVITNAHCTRPINDYEPIKYNFTVNYFRENDPDAKTYSLAPSVVGLLQDLDFAILDILGPDIEDRFAPDFSDGMIYPPEPGDELLVLQHPYGYPMLYKRDCKILRLEDVSISATRPTGQTTVLRAKIVHDCSTTSGSSGSLLQNLTRRNVAGMHRSRGQDFDTNEGFTAESIMSRSGVAEQIRWERQSLWPSRGGVQLFARYSLSFTSDGVLSKIEALPTPHYHRQEIEASLSAVREYFSEHDLTSAIADAHFYYYDFASDGDYQQAEVVLSKMISTTRSLFGAVGVDIGRPQSFYELDTYPYRDPDMRAIPSDIFAATINVVIPYE